MAEKEEEKEFDWDNWKYDENDDDDDDDDDGSPEKSLLRLEKQREKLRKLHQDGKLSDKKLLFHESQLDSAVLSISSAQEIKTGKRSNVITVRLNDEALQCLDDLLSANIAQSRSQAASMLINEGINAKSSLFNEIRKHIEEINSSRQMLQQTILDSGFGKIE